MISLKRYPLAFLASHKYSKEKDRRIQTKPSGDLFRVALQLTTPKTFGQRTFG